MARRIIFNEETIEAIRAFAETEQHSLSETSNRFGISNDVLRRVMFENNIHPKQTPYSKNWESVTPEKEIEVVKLYKCTNATMSDICKETKLEYCILQSILRKYFTEEEMKKRKSRIYRQSKLGSKNPQYNIKTPRLSDESIEEVDGTDRVPTGDGWYIEVKKPSWYTGRAKSGTVFEHTVVMCQALGLTELPKGYVVHHIDRNRHNNNINNLALMSLSAHSRLHILERKMILMQGSETIPTGVGESPNA